MLLKDEKKIPLSPPMHKILCASTAYEDSFVLLRLEGLGRQETIVHLNKEGTVLW